MLRKETKEKVEAYNEKFDELKLRMNALATNKSNEQLFDNQERCIRELNQCVEEMIASFTDHIKDTQTACVIYEDVLAEYDEEEIEK